mmetsp:Transcript_4504/g.11594  ORF Transcript_4504/g.11594 Transcript_4504/m.11594 type:complete len:119 (+) Transcript_4504:820-1176(+)
MPRLGCVACRFWLALAVTFHHHFIFGGHHDPTQHRPPAREKKYPSGFSCSPRSSHPFFPRAAAAAAAACPSSEKRTSLPAKFATLAFQTFAKKNRAVALNPWGESITILLLLIGFWLS